VADGGGGIDSESTQIGELATERATGDDLRAVVSLSLHHFSGFL